MGDDCIFCKIAKGEISHGTIYEDRYTVAFLDIKPAGKGGGHTLVIPKKHYETIADIPDDELAAVALTVKKVSVALLSMADGVNVVQNNKRAADQFVMHAHFHILPRRKGDGVTIGSWMVHDYAPGEMDKTCQKMKTLLKKK